MANEDEGKLVLYETCDQGITTITINRPHVRNAVNRATALKLAEAFQAFENDSSQKVCIFTGAGDTFCAGYDLHEVAASSMATASSKRRPEREHKRDQAKSPKSTKAEKAEEAERKPLSPAQPVDKVNGALGPMGPSRMTFTKPIIAAVSGYAVAGGLELSLLADIRVAESNAVFGVFCRRFGVPLIDGGTVRLQRVVGLGRAMDMILTGRAVKADEALAFGLVNRVVVGKGEAVREARRLAEMLLAFPQRCMRADLVSAHHAAYDAKSLEDALRFEFEGGEGVIQHESLAGAKRFDGGIGRGGKFDIAAPGDDPGTLGRRAGAAPAAGIGGRDETKRSKL
ncbi:enoyl-CoA hydratase/isomerase family protein [Pochonia chlamydosporia 170]|uniref:Enoyl-CoA hydratase/isomerase family protein n=1 Tax=Pochonia chlamydosporia 170 TaxID=1380566 RepID=A0A179FG93_METCM|nr:enoyl-CoA hydratase/isomerase family protein [Pochonia chlamydosporia 170]OAQ64556.1 enoyl-CoA hydratase/isomerase family protein [Pochonia chlamydosporia 170]